MARRYRSVAAIIALAGVVLQYVLVIAGEPGSAARVTFNFFSYFTILTNILMALAFALPAVRPGGFFERPEVRTAIAVYAVVVVGIYQVILSSLWDPQGASFVADTLLHKVTPALFVLDWLLFVPKAELRWRTARDLLVFPVVFGAWTLIHAPFSGFYPYPFVEVPKLGLTNVLLNLGAILALFLVLGLGFIAFGRARGWHFAQLSPPS